MKDKISNKNANNVCMYSFIRYFFHSLLFPYRILIVQELIDYLDFTISPSHVPSRSRQGDEAKMETNVN